MTAFPHLLAPLDLGFTTLRNRHAGVRGSRLTLRFRDGKPAAATAIVVSTQHAAGMDNDDSRAKLRAYVKGVMADVLP